MKTSTTRTTQEAILIVLVSIAAIGWAVAYYFNLNGYNLAVQDGSVAIFVSCCVFETVRTLKKRRQKK